MLTDNHKASAAKLWAKAALALKCNVTILPEYRQRHKAQSYV